MHNFLRLILIVFKGTARLNDKTRPILPAGVIGHNKLASYIKMSRDDLSLIGRFKLVVSRWRGVQ